ncbi:DUF3558 domain-containing protein [Saccharopolyspora antimicrobica]|uniref:DUF3558 domain-containing protein n=1 Tax=Saccharopolyspora antimicrobica TaxID=455193 RepID=UPI001476C7BD|nr:DUF3558 domain-containing protein [Saccharopolyspora antimicrobica]
MRKGLAVGAVFAAVLLAGCSGGGNTTETTAASTPAEQPSSPPSSARTAPAKSLDISDKCGIVAESQWRNLGGDQAPRPRELEGIAGCGYAAGEAGTDGGWSVFVGTDPNQTFKDFVDSSDAEMTEVAGYPAAEVGGVPTNCILVLDVSDQGSLAVHTLARTGNPNPCDLSKQFAEAALQNLPNV